MKTWFRVVFAFAGAFSIGIGSAAAEEWWMVDKGEDGKMACVAPLEHQGNKLTPPYLVKNVKGCSLSEETPSMSANVVVVNCAGNIGRVFIFASSLEACDKLGASRPK